MLKNVTNKKIILIIMPDQVHNLNDSTFLSAQINLPARLDFEQVKWWKESTSLTSFVSRHVEQGFASFLAIFLA